MLVGDVMTRRPVTVTEGTRVKAAVSLLAEHAVTSLPVVDARGRLRGMVSEADLIRDLVGPDPRVHELPPAPHEIGAPDVVGEVMSPHAITVHADTELALAVELMTSTP